MKITSKSGTAIAAAAATLFLAGATMSTVAYAAGEGKCVGANACKGQSACKGGNHSCKGLNACKGQGFSAMTKDKCDAAKGKYAGIVSEVLEFLNCCSLALGGWMHVAHGHLNVGMASKFAKGGDINSRHGHASQCRVAEVVQPEIRLETGSFQRGHVCLSYAAERPQTARRLRKEPQATAVLQTDLKHAPGASREGNSPLCEGGLALANPDEPNR